MSQLKHRLVLALLLFSVALVPGFWATRLCANDVRTLLHLACPDNAQRSVTCEATEPRHLRIEIANADLLQADGSGPVRRLDLNAVGLIWLPSALLLACGLAAPGSLIRKSTLVILGQFALQSCFALTLAFTVWEESAAIGLARLGPQMRTAASLAAGFMQNELTLALVLFAGGWALLAPPTVGVAQARALRFQTKAGGAKGHN